MRIRVGAVHPQIHFRCRLQALTGCWTNHDNLRAAQCTDWCLMGRLSTFESIWTTSALVLGLITSLHIYKTTLQYICDHRKQNSSRTRLDFLTLEIGIIKLRPNSFQRLLPKQYYLRRQDRRIKTNRSLLWITAAWIIVEWIMVVMVVECLWRCVAWAYVLIRSLIYTLCTPPLDIFHGETMNWS
jgi:hypothetical protein